MIGPGSVTLRLPVLSIRGRSCSISTVRPMASEEIDGFLWEVLEAVPVSGSRRRVIRADVEGRLRKVMEGLRQKGVDETRLAIEAISIVGPVRRLSEKIRGEIAYGRTLSLRRAAAGVCLLLSLGTLLWTLLHRGDLAVLQGRSLLLWSAAVHLPLLLLALPQLWRGRRGRFLETVPALWLAIFWIFRGWGLTPAMGAETVAFALLSAIAAGIAIGLVTPWR